MKTPLRIVLAVLAAITLGAIVLRSAVIPPSTDALQTPVPVVVNPAPTQYKVIDIGQIAVAKGRTPAETLEAILNEMGVHGWKAVATSGSFVILMQ